MATEEISKIYSDKGIALLNKRFKDAPWVNVGMKTTISIGGAGGIGSNLAFLLGRMGYPLNIHDYDYVSPENIGVQFFTPGQIGLYKTSSIVTNIDMFTFDFAAKGKIQVLGRIVSSSIMQNVSISCFDNMEARKIMFQRWKVNLNKIPSPPVPIIFIDGRMTAETFQIYVVSKESDIERYEATLFNDSEVPDLPCAFKSTPHNSMMIACYITSILNNYYFNYFIQDDIREVPFYVEVQQASLNFKTV